MLSSNYKIDIEVPYDILLVRTNLDIMDHFIFIDTDTRRESVDRVVDRMKKAANMLSVDANETFLFNQCYKVLIRLSRQCPYNDVRQNIINELKIFDKYKIPNIDDSPSRFLLQEDFPTGSQLETKTFEEIFAAFHGRIPSVYLSLGFNSTLLERFFDTINVLMLRVDGPLPRSWRHYIAIMGASRHRCEPLVRLQEELFIADGGDPNWLKDNTSVPEKLTLLVPISMILAHAPHLITPIHIQNLKSGSRPWSQPEIAHAVVILSTFHSLCSVVYGLGLQCEVDLSEGVCEVVDPQDTPLTLEKDTHGGHTGRRVIDLLQRYEDDAEWNEIVSEDWDKMFLSYRVERDVQDTLKAAMEAVPRHTHALASDRISGYNKFITRLHTHTHTHTHT
eukprot:GHVR01122068.1.p1 GENE.GHVR01122068.1~~GHVR01122068.1.p1  ORF type:complete len:392 (-),score=118.00 GHVR01122068.1:71-1246(-)